MRSEAIFGLRAPDGYGFYSTPERLRKVPNGARVSLFRVRTTKPSVYAFLLGTCMLAIAFAGSFFTKTIEQEIAFQQTVTFGQYRFVSQALTQENYGGFCSEFLLLDLYRAGDKHRITQLTPQIRFTPKSQTVSLLTSGRATLRNDVTVTFVGKNPSTGNPIFRNLLK